MENVIKKIESLKRQHYYCEDTWYSCPKHPNGCADETEPDECNCGADKYNDLVDEIVAELRATDTKSEER